MVEDQVKLNLIYGRSGTGKSEYIYNDISQKMGQFKNIFIIVPEQSNLMSERKFFEITGKKAMLNVEVLTLSRMAYRVLNEVGGVKSNLSKIGKSMIIYDLLSKNKKDLNFLGKSNKNVDVVDKMFTELKKHKVSIDDLKNIDIPDKYTSLKLKDIELLYEKYEQKLAGQFIDENDSLTILGENIKFSTMFNDSSIYFDDFFGFTPQEYFIFEELIKKCKEVSITFCLDKIETSQTKENDIFYFNRKFAKKILEIADRQKCKIELKSFDEAYRFKNDE